MAPFVLFWQRQTRRPTKQVRLLPPTPNGHHLKKEPAKSRLRGMILHPSKFWVSSRLKAQASSFASCSRDCGRFGGCHLYTDILLGLLLCLLGLSCRVLRYKTEIPPERLMVVTINLFLRSVWMARHSRRPTQTRLFLIILLDFDTPKLRTEASWVILALCFFIPCRRLEGHQASY